jgi:4-alpha-glucanotransferase
MLHPTSLPGPFGIGDLGPEADRFLAWASAAGQSLWQVLPLGPNAYANSPYGVRSAYAGNPLLVSPELLRDDGLLPASALDGAPAFPEERVDFGAVIPWKEALLRASWEHVRSGRAPSRIRGALESFRAAPEQSEWLHDWTLFLALKERHEGKSWPSWEPALRRREPGALSRAANELRDATDYQAYLQFLFFRQWERVRNAARERGIRILGDAPIYVALDGVDVWTSPHLFQLDERMEPVAVSGVPPDYFSETGQLWGSPLYRWDRIEAEGFEWWIRRIRAELRKFDLLRIDHFRAFASYWAVPAGEKTALNGRWEPGPGMRLFRALDKALGGLPLIAEDLGDIDDTVRALVKETGLPGMRVLQFGLLDPASEHSPDRYPERCVAYTGTHDNDTARGWFDSLDPERRREVLERLDWDGSEIEWEMIRALYESAAERAIVPIQDVLGLGSEARMNTPARALGNWEFRVRPGALTSKLAARLRGLAVASGRAAPRGRG